MGKENKIQVHTFRREREKRKEQSGTPDGLKKK